MTNLSGTNPNLTTAGQVGRYMDAKDDLLTIGEFSAITSTASGTGIAIAAESLDKFKAVIHRSALTTSDGGSTNYWTISVQAADNASYTNAVTLASVALSGSASSDKLVLAISGDMVYSLMSEKGESTTTHVRAVATETGTASALTAGVYLTV